MFYSRGTPPSPESIILIKTINGKGYHQSRRCSRDTYPESYIRLNSEPPRERCMGTRTPATSTSASESAPRAPANPRSFFDPMHWTK